MSEIEELRKELRSYKAQYDDRDEPCEAEESPSEYNMAYDASAKSVSKGISVVASGHRHTVSLPAGSSMGAITINGAGYQDDTYSMSMQDDLPDTLQNLKKSLQERVLQLKDDLSSLSDRYEAAESALQQRVQQIKDIDTALAAINPSVPDDYDDIPF